MTMPRCWRLPTLTIVGLFSLLLFSVYWGKDRGRGLSLYLSASSSELGGQAKATTSDNLGVVLHPEHHIYRNPKVIDLNWHVSAGLRYPDGVKKRIYLLNNEFPGPTIEARSGDELVVHVRNDLADEGVSIHWHGIPVPNEMDGAVGFTQCPIGPSKNFTYRFRVPDNCHGTFWWHGHLRSQRADGLFGGFVVHKPHADGGRTDLEMYTYTQDVLLVVGDWFHRSADEILEWYSSSRSFGNEPVPDSLLINGRSRFNCTMAVPARPVECSRLQETDMKPLLPSPRATSRLRFVNVGTVAGFSAQVSGATLKLVTVDGGFTVKPALADRLGVIYPGERVDAIVSWQGDNVTQTRLLIILDEGNFKYTNPSLNPKQSFPMLGSKLGDATGLSMNLDTFSEPQIVLDITGTAISSDHTPALPDKAQYTILIYIKTQLLARYDNKPMGFMNHTSWSPQQIPLLSLPRSEWGGNQFVPHIPMSTERTDTVWVDLVLNNQDDGSHPFHLHGLSFYVLSRYRAGRGGWGSWNPYEEEAPPGEVADAPLLKDTVSVPRRGNAWLRFPETRAGIWMLHCHMSVHFGAGMAMGLHLGPEGDEEHRLGASVDASKLCSTDPGR